MRKQIKLLEYHSHFFAGFVDIVAFSGNGFPFESDLALGWFLQQIQTAEKGTLPRAAGADHNDDLSFGDFQVDPLQNVKLAELFMQIFNGDHWLSTSFRTDPKYGTV